MVGEQKIGNHSPIGEFFFAKNRLHKLGGW